MTINEKLDHIINALAKIHDGREGWLTRLDLDLISEEYDVIEASLEIAAAGICTLFRDKTR